MAPLLLLVFGLLVCKTKSYHIEHNLRAWAAPLSLVVAHPQSLGVSLSHGLTFRRQFLLADSSEARDTQGFFQDILALTKYCWFESWQHLLDFKLSDSPPAQTADSS
ncbi:hypothetical protein [Phormidesmis sp. 146-20]